jgi:hypothetical protein
MYKADRAKYESTARSWTQKYAMGWHSSRWGIWCTFQRIILYCLGFSCAIQHLRHGKNQTGSKLIVNEVVDDLLQVFSEHWKYCCISVPD